MKPRLMELNASVVIEKFRNNKQNSWARDVVGWQKKHEPKRQTASSCTVNRLTSQWKSKASCKHAIHTPSASKVTLNWYDKYDVLPVCPLPTQKKDDFCRSSIILFTQDQIKVISMALNWDCHFPNISYSKRNTKTHWHTRKHALYLYDKPIIILIWLHG